MQSAKASTSSSQQSFWQNKTSILTPQNTIVCKADPKYPPKLLTFSGWLPLASCRRIQPTLLPLVQPTLMPLSSPSLKHFCSLKGMFHKVHTCFLSTTLSESWWSSLLPQIGSHAHQLLYFRVLPYTKPSSEEAVGQLDWPSVITSCLSETASSLKSVVIPYMSKSQAAVFYKG